MAGVQYIQYSYNKTHMLYVQKKNGITIYLLEQGKCILSYKVKTFSAGNKENFSIPESVGTLQWKHPKAFISFWFMVFESF